jgi:soluble calcium-activated nucleotidase 1|eukprot:g6020.t1
MDLSVVLSVVLVAYIAFLFGRHGTTLQHQRLGSTEGMATEDRKLQLGPDSKVTAAAMVYFNGGVRRVGKVDTGSLLFDRTKHRVAIVTDLDEKSRDPNKFLWRSYMKQGTLIKISQGAYAMEWDKEVRALVSKTATSNRSMELSALVRYQHWLLGMCDYTGLVFKIVDNGVFQRWAIADGNGDAAKPFKTEWATVKDDKIWVGSTGKPWTNKGGGIVHNRPLWVKIINADGRIFNLYWGDIYLALRTATNSTEPGYLWHEAIHWDPRSKRWIILPRKISNSPYWPDDDETRGTNLLIVANEDFSRIDVKTVGPLEPEYGFTAVRKVPGTDGLYLALKVKELAGPPAVTHTKMCMFDLDGKMYFDPPFLPVDNQKFEGLEFL